MRRSISRDYLDRLLADEKLNDMELEELIDGDEDLFLEFKEADLGTEKGKKATAKKIREAVCGFGNSEGGIFLLGVRQKPKPHIVGIQNVNGLKLDEWLGTVLSPINPQFSMMPRIYVHKHSKGEVLIVAVSRAHDAVRISEKRTFGYYLRFPKSTERAPDYLVTDLLLGRRAHPVLALECDNAAVNGSEGFRSVTFNFMVENIGLVPAKDVVVGMVSWHAQLDEPKLNRFLAAHVDIQEPTCEEGLCAFKPAHRIGAPTYTENNDVPPFSTSVFIGVGPFKLPVSTYERINDHVCAALYALPVGHPPLWFQMKYTLSNVYHKGIQYYEVRDVEIDRIFGGRPLVSFEHAVC